jgi:hypothetical protein
MKPRFAARAVALLSGALFGTGLVISGMTRPDKVIGFLDLFGSWDPTLMFVMVGAIVVHFTAYRLIRRRSAPVLASTWSLPTRRDIDVRLVVGAAIFGVGWGLAGYCPGPAVTSLAKGAGPIVFVGAMLAGMYGTARLERLLARPRRHLAESEAQS